MIKDFRKKKINAQFNFFDILQLPHTVISNSEKFTHPIVYTYTVWHKYNLLLKDSYYTTRPT